MLEVHVERSVGVQVPPSTIIMEFYMKLGITTKILISVLVLLVFIPVVFIFFIITNLITNIPISQNLYFDQQKNFDGYVDYKFFKNLSTCHSYTTPIIVNAPLFIPIGYYKTQIVGVSNNKCIVRNYRKDSPSVSWKLSEEFQLPIDYSKDLGTLMMREIKNPNERLAHQKKYCEAEEIKSYTCWHLTDGTDISKDFSYINLGLEKYQTYPYTYYQQIPIQNKTFYTNK